MRRKTNGLWRGQFPEQGIAQENPVKQGHAVHAEQIGEYQFPVQQRQYKTAEIHRADIVAEGQQEAGFLPVDFPA